jgi:hypothetical protein
MFWYSLKRLTKILGDFDFKGDIDPEVQNLPRAPPRGGEIFLFWGNFRRINA